MNLKIQGVLAGLVSSIQGTWTYVNLYGTPISPNKISPILSFRSRRPFPSTVITGCLSRGSDVFWDIFCDFQLHFRSLRRWDKCRWTMAGVRWEKTGAFVGCFSQNIRLKCTTTILDKVQRDFFFHPFYFEKKTIF